MARSVVLAITACITAVVFAALLLWGQQPQAGAPRLLQRLCHALQHVLLVTPSFLLAAFLLHGVALRLRWFPVHGSSTGDWWITPGHLVLPTLAVALPLAAYLASYLGQHMARDEFQPWYLSAKGRGIPGPRLFWNHQMRQALPVLVQVLGLYLPALCNGVFIVESIFGWSGLGLLMVDAATGRDYPLLIGGCLWSAWMTVLAYQFADVQRDRLATGLETQ
nr:ABC transporter permease [Acanthopleuribacter pedis]